MTPVTRDTVAELPAHLRDLAEFVTASPSSYHAAEEVARRLEAVGFTRLDETADFPAAPGGYVVVRDGAVSSRYVNPAAVSRRATSAAAWKLDGEAATKSARSSAWARAAAVADTPPA